MLELAWAVDVGLTQVSVRCVCGQRTRRVRHRAEPANDLAAGADRGPVLHQFAQLKLNTTLLACSVQCAVCSVQCAVCSVQCVVWYAKCVRMRVRVCM
jgi:hypothetical protein